MANIVVYLMNRCTTSGVHNVTPHEKYYGRKMDLSHLRIFGTIAYMHILEVARAKMNDRNLPKLYLGEVANTVVYLMNRCTTSGVHN